MRRDKVLIFGTFDHFHPGHEFVLNEAMKRGDVTVVVARDRNVKRLKKKSAMQSEDERAQAIRGKFPAVSVMLGDPNNFLAPVIAIAPDLILLGYDQKLPPGVTEKDLPGTVERLPAFHPDKYKSSLRKP